MSTHRRIQFFHNGSEWFWRVRAKNGRIIAVGGEGYLERREVIKAAMRALDLALPQRQRGEGPERVRPPSSVIQPRGTRAEVEVYYDSGRIVFASWLFGNGYFYELTEVEDG